MSERPHAILVNKGTIYSEMATEQAEAERVPDVGGTVYFEQVKASHERHQRALDHIVEVLEALGWRYDLVHRDEFGGPHGHDIVLSAGGDGTVLHASHFTDRVPLLGINSDPERSVGYFCGTGPEGVEKALREFEADRLERFELHRLKLELDGEEVGCPALNDVLVANENPGATSQYILVAGPRQERQKSSGIWISTPAGSTAGIRSAGGVVLPLNLAQLQYLVREPVRVASSMHYELLRGVRDLSEGIEVFSLMSNGNAYIDGPHEVVRLPLGSRLRISANQPLTLLGLEPTRRER